MAIEFRCAQCNRLLRTGDETAGRHAQCPECGAIGAVPTPAAAGEIPAPPFAAAGGNPFALGQIPDVQPPSDNPYQSPMSPAYPVLRLTDAAAKQRVAGPATALIVTAVLGLIQDLPHRGIRPRDGIRRARGDESTDLEDVPSYPYHCSPSVCRAGS